MTTTGLAAVAAATDSVSKADHEKAIGVARQEGDQAGHTRGHADGLKAGAEAERQRLLGIEAHAMTGNEKLIAECKADPACTPDQAAGRILAAEKLVRENQMKGIAAVEDKTGKVTAAVTTAPTTATTVPQTAEGWKAEWAASAALQADFRTGEAYAAYRQGIAEGRIKVLKTPATAA